MTRPSPRQVAEGMRPDEAVDYLLRLVEAASALADVHPADKLAPNATRSEQLILRALYDASPRPVSRAALCDLVAADRYPSDPAADPSAAVHVTRIRKKLRRGQILTEWGFGYRWDDGGL